MSTTKKANATEGRSPLHTVTVGSTEIRYQVRRSARRKTVGLSVGLNGVVVAAPPSVSASELEGFVRRKSAWILGLLRRFSEMDELRPREFISGETYLYRGRQARLKVVEVELGVAVLPERPVYLEWRQCSEGEWLFAHVPAGQSEADRARLVRNALEGWYFAEAAECLRERVEAWYARLGVPFPRRIEIRSPRTMWGSCNGELVRFNWKIVQAPLRLIDYVVVHELAHMRYLNHSKAFWEFVGRAMPDHENRRAQLRKLGPRLDW